MLSEEKPSVSFVSVNNVKL